MPGYYHIPITNSFIDTLALGFKEKFSSSKNNYSDITLILPNNKSCQNFKFSLGKIHDGPIALPQIISLSEITEIHNDSFYDSDSFKSIPEHFEDHEISTFLTSGLMQKFNDLLDKKPLGFYKSLAESFLQFIGELENADISENRLNALRKTQLFANDNSSFLDNLLTAYKHFKSSTDKISYIERRNLIIKKRSEFYNSTKPENHILIAGSTGSVKATRNLIAEISSLKNGHAIIQSQDVILGDSEITASNPAHPISDLKESLNIKQDKPWYESEEIQPTQNIAKAIFTEAKNPLELDNLKLLEADNIYIEAKIIALLICKESAKNCSSLIICNNPELKKLIYLELNNFGFIDTNYEKKNISNQNFILHLNLVRDLVKLLHDKSDQNQIRNILKSPLIKEQDQIDELLQLTLNSRNKILTSKLDRIPDSEMLKNFFNFLEELHFNSKLKSQAKDLILNYLKLTELLQIPCEDQLIRFLSEIANLDNDLELSSPLEFLEFLERKIYAENINIDGKEITIVSSMDARLKLHDNVIISDFNEGTFPEKTKSNSFMSDFPEINNELNEKHFSQLANDIAGQLFSKNVFLTRSKFIKNKETIASRWLIKLQLMLKDSEDILDNSYAEAIAKLSVCEQVTSEISQASPDSKARIHNFSITQIETLLRNPYAIYAENILRLRELKDFSQETAADFGNFIHNCLDHYGKNIAKLNTEEKLTNTTAYAIKLLDKLNISKAIKNLWLIRYENIAKWFIEIDSNNNAIEVFTEYSLESSLPECQHILLKGKIDRLEISDSGFEVIDFKTGSMPKVADINLGISSQLPLECLLVTKNLNLNNAKASYYIVSGRKAMAGEVKEVKRLDELLSNAGSGLTNAIKQYQDENTPLIASPDPRRKPAYDNYKHLAR